jgi:hypothetical protein
VNFLVTLDRLKTEIATCWLVILFMNFVMDPKTMSKAIMYARYGLLALLNFVFTYLIGYTLSFLVVLFAPASGWLPKWLCWFQTFDASLDAGWQGGYFGTYATAPTGFSRYLLRLRWLWRNMAYGFDYWPCGIVYDPTQWVIDTCETQGVLLQKFAAHTLDGKHFCYTDSTGKKYGWKLWWALDANFKLIPAASYTHVSSPMYGVEKPRLMLVCTP